MGTKNKPGEFDCYDAAKDDEPMFVLLARDGFAPYLVELWANERTRNRGLNDPKAAEAYACAKTMKEWRNAHHCSDPNCRHTGAQHEATGRYEGRTLYGGCDCYGFDPDLDRPIRRADSPPTEDAK